MLATLLHQTPVRFALPLVLSLALVSTYAQGQDQDSTKPDETSQAGEQDESAENPVTDENVGQVDLDQAFALKVGVSSTRDLDKIADLCESAIDKGLNKESTEHAKELWAAVLLEHARQLNRRIAPDGKLSTRWRWMRAQAITRLNKAIELRPEKVNALILLARLHSLNAGDRDAAIAAIEKAIERISGDKEKLSEALYIRARLAEDEQSRIADLTQAVKIDPQNIDALMQRAMFYLSEEKSAEAMADFKQLLNVESDNVKRYIVISETLRRRGLLAETVTILDLAIAADDDNDDLLVLRGRAHLANENDDEALADLNQAIGVNRQNLDAIDLRARIYLTRDEFDKALDDANELIQQNPENPLGLGLRSLIYRSQMKLDEAIADVEKLMEDDPENLNYKFDLGILYNANEQPSKAIPIFDEILRYVADEIQVVILRSRGDAHLSVGDHQRAVKDYDRALRQLERNRGDDEDEDSDTESGILNNLAWVLATSPEDDLRDGGRAIKLATKAAELTEYKAAFILSTLASGYAESSDFESARKWAAKAVELAESDEQREGLQEELESYKLDKPWREKENVEADKADNEESASDDEKGDGSEDKGNQEDQQKSDDDSAGEVDGR